MRFLDGAGMTKMGQQELSVEDVVKTVNPPQEKTNEFCRGEVTWEYFRTSCWQRVTAISKSESSSIAPNFASL